MESPWCGKLRHTPFNGHSTTVLISANISKRKEKLLVNDTDRNNFVQHDNQCSNPTGFLSQDFPGGGLSGQRGRVTMAVPWALPPSDSPPIASARLILNLRRRCHIWQACIAHLRKVRSTYRSKGRCGTEVRPGIENHVLRYYRSRTDNRKNYGHTRDWEQPVE